LTTPQEVKHRRSQAAGLLAHWSGPFQTHSLNLSLLEQEEPRPAAFRAAYLNLPLPGQNDG